MGDVRELKAKPWTWTTGRGLANTYVLRFHDADAGMVSFLDEVPLRTLRMDAIVEALNATQTHPSLG